MTLGWQDAIAFVAVLAAGGWLVRRRLRQRRSGCSDCLAGEPKPTGEKLIAVSSIRSRSKRPFHRPWEGGPHSC